MPKLQEDNRVQDTIHAHTWRPTVNLGEFRCSTYYKNAPCKAVKISAKEFDRRTDIWITYYEAVKLTKGHELLQKMKRAVKMENREAMLAEVKKVRAEIAEHTHIVLNKYGDEVIEPNVLELELPEFPDPMHPRNNYVVEATI